MIKRWIQDWLGIVSDVKVDQMMKKAADRAIQNSLSDYGDSYVGEYGYMFRQIKRLITAEISGSIRDKVDKELTEQLGDEEILDNIVKRIQDKQL